MTRTKPIELGSIFGELIVLSELNKDKNHRLMYLCECSCGNKHIVSATKLRVGRAKTCGKDHNKEKRYGLSAANRLYVSYKWHAQNRNILFELTKDQFLSITTQNCKYCGDLPESVIKDKNYYGEYKYNGLDRLDNNIGYTIDNVVACCGFCNIAKNKYSKEYFYDKVIKIYNRMNNDN